MKQKTISIITPSFNQGQFIARTIESVLSQAGDFYLDYIIVDACSTDNSVEIIAKYESMLDSGNWLIQCLGINYRWLSEPDKGQPDGINKGLRIATGFVFGWLNSDDLYYPDALQKIVHLDWMEIDFCYGKGMWIDKNGDNLDLYHTFTPNKYSLHFQCTLCQPTVFFSRNAYSQLGELCVYYDFVFDYEYWLRGVFKGMKFSYIPSLLAMSRMYKENKSVSSPILAGQERNKLIGRYFSNININKILLFFWKCVVNENTNKKVRNLMSKIYTADLH